MSTWERRLTQYQRGSSGSILPPRPVAAPPADIAPACIPAIPLNVDPPINVDAPAPVAVQPSMAPAIGIALKPPAARMRPAPKARRSFAELMSSFMEENNIRWGELLGGLLIVGCSIALVVSFWAEISQRPIFKFCIFTAVTAALFGVGLYCEHRWRLPTTSRGILLIATLLVPLNCLAFAAFSANAVPGAIVLGAQAIAFMLFAMLVWSAAKVLTPQAPGLLAIGTLWLSGCILALRWIVPAQVTAAQLIALSLLPVGSYLGCNALMLRGARRWKIIRPAAANGIFLILAVLSFATALAMGLLVSPATSPALAHHPQPLGWALRRLSAVISAGGWPALAAGLLLWRRSALIRLASSQTLEDEILLSTPGQSGAEPTFVENRSDRRAAPDRDRSAGTSEQDRSTNNFDPDGSANNAARGPMQHGAPDPGRRPLVELPDFAPAWTRRNREGLRSSVEKVRTAALSIAIVGALIMLAGIALAWPAPGAVVAVALLDFAVLSAIAFLYDIPAAHVLALPCLWIASLVGFHLFRGNVAWNGDGATTAGQLVQPISGTVLSALALVAGAGAWLLSRWKSAHASAYAAMSIAAALLGVLLLNVNGFAAGGDPALATIVYLAFASVAFFVAVKLHRTDLHWLAWLLLGAALAQGIVSRGIAHQPWSAALLAWASAASAAFVLVKRVLRRDAAKQIEPAFWISLIASIIGVALALTDSSLPLIQAAPPPLLWMAGIWLLIAVGSGYPLIASTAVCCAVTAGYFIPIRHLRLALIPSDIPHLLDANAASLALFALAGAAMWRMRTREPAARQPAFIKINLLVAMALVALVLVPATALLTIDPRTSLLIQTAGDAWSWMAVLTLTAAAFLRQERIASFVSIRTVALAAMTLSALLACTTPAFSALPPWTDFHVLLGGTVAAAWLVLGYGAWLGRRLSGLAVTDAAATDRDGLTLRYHQPARNAFDAAAGRASLVFGSDRLVPTVIGWVVGVCGIAILLALRAMLGDPAAPWPSLSTVGAAAAVSTLLSCWSYRGSLLLGAALLLNLGASLWFMHDRSQIPGDWLLNFLCINAIALALPGVAWLVLDIQLLRPASSGLKPFIAPHRIAAVGSLALLTYIVVVLLPVRTTSGSSPLPNEFMTYIAMLAVAAVCIAGLWDTHPRNVLKTLYVCAMLAIGLGLQFSSTTLHLTILHGQLLFVGLTLVVGMLWTCRATVGRVAGRMNVCADRSAEHSWIAGITAAIAVLVTGIAFWSDFAVADVVSRLLAGVAALSQAVALALLSHGGRKPSLRHSTLGLFAIAAVAFAWGWLPPVGPSLLDRSVVVFITFAAVSGVYLLAVRALLSEGDAWRTAAAHLGRQVAIAAAAAMAVTLGAEVFQYMDVNRVDISLLDVVLISIALLGGCVGAVYTAIRATDLSNRLRSGCVYIAEALLALAFIHLRVTEPRLFHGYLHAFWPLIVMAIAFAGVGVGEVLRRQNRTILSRPLQTTGIFLPLLPVISFWIAPAAGVGLGELLIVVAVFYGLLAGLRQAFGFAVLAAIAANGALWNLLANLPAWGFAQHPQVWLIPISLAVLVAAQLNRDRLGGEQLRLIRYACLLVVYASSTADVFVNGVANAPWLPLVLAGLSVSGVMVGILFRIRPFLYLGSSFLLLSILTMIYYASSQLHWTWIWYVAGIALGTAIISLFALFEKKRSEMTALVEGLRTWQ